MSDANDKAVPENDGADGAPELNATPMETDTTPGEAKVKLQSLNLETLLEAKSSQCKTEKSLSAIEHIWYWGLQLLVCKVLAIRILVISTILEWSKATNLGSPIIQ